MCARAHSICRFRRISKHNVEEKEANLSPKSAPVEKRTKWEREPSEIQIKPPAAAAVTGRGGGRRSNHKADSSVSALALLGF